MLKRVLATTMLFIMFFHICAVAEKTTEDYSWLDDFTINQLKLLDEEIHKRISSDYMDSSATDNDSIVLGKWWQYGTLTHVDKYDKTKFQHDHKSVNLIIFLPDGKLKIQEICIECAYIDKSIGGSYEIMNEDTVYIRALFSALTGTIREDSEGSHFIKFDTNESQYYKIENETALDGEWLCKDTWNVADEHKNHTFIDHMTLSNGKITGQCICDDGTVLEEYDGEYEMLSSTVAMINGISYGDFTVTYTVDGNGTHLTSNDSLFHDIYTKSGTGEPTKTIIEESDSGAVEKAKQYGIELGSKVIHDKRGEGTVVRIFYKELGGVQELEILVNYPDDSFKDYILPDIIDYGHLKVAE